MGPEGLLSRPSAVLDIGSNSVLLLVAERLPAGQLKIVCDESIVTRLSENAAKTGRLDPGAIARTLEALKRHMSRARDLGAQPIAVATEGLRMVADADAFLVPAAEILGGPVRLLSGDEEAELSYRSVADDAGTGELRVLDIGGGSTELVSGVGLKVVSATSHAIGSVRLTEAHVRSDPPTAVEIAAIEASIRSALAAQPLDPLPELHGVAGTVTSAATLMLGLESYDRERIDRSRFPVSEIRALRDRLAALTLDQRADLAGLGRGRADVAVAGVTILLMALEHCGATTLVVRDRGLRYALLP